MICVPHVSNKIEMLFPIHSDCMDTQTSDTYEYSFFCRNLCSQTSWAFSFHLDFGYFTYYCSRTFPVSPVWSKPCFS